MGRVPVRAKLPHQSSSVRGAAREAQLAQLAAEYADVRAAWDDGRVLGSMLRAVDEYKIRLAARGARYRWVDDTELTVWGECPRNAKPVARPEHASEAACRLAFYAAGLEHRTPRERYAHGQGTWFASADPRAIEIEWEEVWKGACRATEISEPVSTQVLERAEPTRPSASTRARTKRKQRDARHMVAIREYIAAEQVAIKRLETSRTDLLRMLDDMKPDGSPHTLPKWTAAKYDDAIRDLKGDPSCRHFVETWKRHRKRHRAAHKKVRRLLGELVALERQRICAMVDNFRLSKSLDSLRK